MKIAQVINSNSWGEISPDSFGKGIGGREGALVRLAKEWAKLGHEVTNFVSSGGSQRFEERLFDSAWPPGGFHEYVPTNLAKPMLRAFPYDAVVAWECPSVFADEQIQEQQKVRLVHMQVAHLAERDEAEHFSTGIVALSEWAKDFLQHSGVVTPNWYIRPNGVDISMYPKWEKKPKGIKVVYSSSPDRGLFHLLNMWPEIRKIDKNASLFVAYGATNFTRETKWQHTKLGEMSLEIERGLDQPGVFDVGKIGQAQLAKLQSKANLWLYPCDPIQATETGCITAIENMAAGNPCIMSDADCLESEFSNVSNVIPLPFNASDYVDSIGLAMSVPEDRKRMAVKARSFAESRDWSRIAPTWIDLFEENANV